MRETHSIQILNTIYESLFIVDIKFIDGTQYSANVTDRDPNNDTSHLHLVFVSTIENNLPILERQTYVHLLQPLSMETISQ